MNCKEVNKLLMPYHDGELEPAQAAAVAEALDGCPECGAALEELEQIHALASEAFSAPVASVDLGGVYDGVMARVAAEDSAAEVDAGHAAGHAIDGVRVERDGRLVQTTGPGVFERVGRWFGELIRLERPMAAMAVAAALLATVAGVWLSGSPPAGESVSGDPSIAASPDEPRATPRRGAEPEVMAASRNMASVTVEEVAQGEVTVLEFNEGDETPLVLWHTVDGEGVPAPPKGL